MRGVDLPVPETTSVEALESYIGGQCLRVGRGEAWREIKAWQVAIPSVSERVSLPSVNEPFLAWTISGEADFQEREGESPWISHRIRKGSFFLTSAGAPYDCRWRSVTSEPLESMLVFIELPLLERALVETFGPDAVQVRLRDVSAFHDGILHGFMERLLEELLRPKASGLVVQGLGQAVAVHLARNYSETISGPRSDSPSLPGYKLRQITDWMAARVAEDFSLDELAAQADLSKFHFHRLFKAATGLAPSQYHINLRLETAKRLLRETRQSIVSVALEVGYTNPSHFGQLFRRETGLSPSDYRRQR